MMERVVISLAGFDICCAINADTTILPCEKKYHPGTDPRNWKTCMAHRPGEPSIPSIPYGVSCNCDSCPYQVEKEKGGKTTMTSMRYHGHDENGRLFLYVVKQLWGIDSYLHLWQPHDGFKSKILEEMEFRYVNLDSQKSREEFCE